MGLDGGLAFLALLLFFLPFGIFSTINGIFEYMSGEYWAIYTNPLNDDYIPFYAEITYVEIIANFLMLLLAVYLAFLFFTSKPNFPNFFIRFTIGFYVLDGVLFLANNYIYYENEFYLQEAIFFTSMIAYGLLNGLLIYYVKTSESVAARFAAEVKTSP